MTIKERKETKEALGLKVDIRKNDTRFEKAKVESSVLEIEHHLMKRGVEVAEIHRIYKQAFADTYNALADIEIDFLDNQGNTIELSTEEQEQYQDRLFYNLIYWQCLNWQTWQDFKTAVEDEIGALKTLIRCFDNADEVGTLSSKQLHGTYTYYYKKKEPVLFQSAAPMETLPYLRTNGDSEVIGNIFTTAQECGKEYSLNLTYKEARYAKSKLPTANLKGWIKCKGDPLQYCDQDIYFAFAELGRKNVSKDGTHCLVTATALAKAVFGVKKPQANEIALVTEAIDKRLREADILFTVTDKERRLLDYNLKLLKYSGAFIQTAKVTLQDDKGNVIEGWYFPKNADFVIYELAEAVGRVKRYTPELLPPGYNKSIESHNLFCRLRDRISWWSKKADDRLKRILFEGEPWVQNWDDMTKKQRQDHRKRMLDLLTYWKRRGICEFEEITEQRGRYTVTIGVVLTTVDLERLHNETPLLENQ